MVLFVCCSVTGDFALSWSGFRFVTDEFVAFLICFG